MTALDSVWLDKFKDMLHVLVALPSAFARLTAFIGSTPYHLIENRQTGDLTDTFSDFLTLVIY